MAKPNLLIVKRLDGVPTEEGQVIVRMSMQKEKHPMTQPAWKFDEQHPEVQTEAMKLYPEYPLVNYK